MEDAQRNPLCTPNTERLSRLRSYIEPGKWVKMLALHFSPRTPRRYFLRILGVYSSLCEIREHFAKYHSKGHYPPGQLLLHRIDPPLRAFRISK